METEVNSHTTKNLPQKSYIHNLPQNSIFLNSHLGRRLLHDKNDGRSENLSVESQIPPLCNKTSKDYKRFRQVEQSTGLCLQSSGVELKLYLWLCGVVAQPKASLLVIGSGTVAGN